MLIQHQCYTSLSMHLGASPSHVFTFIIVYKYLYCIVFVLLLAYMSVFESPPCPSMRMGQGQTYSINFPDLREDALDDMLHRIQLQSDYPDLLDKRG